jgi:nicotinate-nucleotide pyrophosphorylase (carboxylating)
MPDDAPQLPHAAVRAIVMAALSEDMPWGDITTDALVPEAVQAHARFVMREAGVVCGLPVARSVFEEIDPSAVFQPCVPEGTRMQAGDVAAEIRGSARSILQGERTALNLLQRMSGIATATSAYVEVIHGTSSTIIDTRKTAPGLRLFDKYSVRCGGGANHRFSLSDGVLVKDNHLAALGDLSMVDALRSMRGRVPHTTKIEVEVDRLEQIEDALAGGADIVLLDNMPPEVLRAAVRQIHGRALTEASGGITFETVRGVAETGVDLISVGALTHSERALEIGLDLEVHA